MDFSETIAACDMKVGKCRQHIEYSRSMSLLDFGSMSFTNLN